MKLSQLLERPVERDVEITHLTQDSRQVRQGSLFFCGKRGELARAYIEDAKSRGAAAVVAPEPGENILVSENPRRDYALACGRFWGNPERELKLVAITGTNGKSSTAWLLQHILPDCGLIGTICSRYGDREIPANYTTPDAGELYPLLAQMKQAGCKTVVMEASSQAIAQERLAGLDFRLGIFTNLSRDHLDQHGTMENYFNVKRNLFTQCRQGLCNEDDEFGLILREKDRLTSYSLYSDTSDYRISQQKAGLFGSEFVIKSQKETAFVHLPMAGEFFISNAGAALAAANLLGMPLEEAAAKIGTCPAVPGRAELLDCGKFRTMIDYAHTSDGVRNILKLAQSLGPKHIHVVFGCAGERDRGDRAAMAQAVLEVADSIVFTADNPREEPWEQICGDISKNERIRCVFERKAAIALAVNSCGEGDLLLLLGKGHERYQALAGKSVYLNEEEVLRECMKKLKKLE